MDSVHATALRRAEDELRLFGTPHARAGLAALLVAWLLFPLVVTDDFWLSVLDYAGIAAIGAIGLNLLTGYAGQISLGHAFFLGAGAYVAAQVGGDLGLAIWLWLPAAALFGGAIGALIGPFALRLSGVYLAIVTIGLVLLGEHLFRNLEGITGGDSGRAVTAPLEIGPLDFNSLELFGTTYTLNQAFFWLTWALVALVALLAKNVVRSRPGLALQAIRERELAAEVVGVHPGRYKVGAFALSSALAAMAGALYGAYQQFVSPEEWTLFLSIQYLAIIVVGGLGTIVGSILGAIAVGGLPALVEQYSDSIPGVATSAGDTGFITVFSLNQAIFGFLIVIFMVFEPRGLAAIWLRARRYIRA